MGEITKKVTDGRFPDFRRRGSTRRGKRGDLATQSGDMSLTDLNLREYAARVRGKLTDFEIKFTELPELLNYADSANAY